MGAPPAEARIILKKFMEIDDGKLRILINFLKFSEILCPDSVKNIIIIEASIKLWRSEGRAPRSERMSMNCS